MRAQYLPTLILGLVLVYIAAFGLTDLGVSFQLSPSLQGNIASQNFSNGEGAWVCSGPSGMLWSVTISGGQLVMSSPYRTWAELQLTLPAAYTVEVTMTLTDQLGYVMLTAYGENYAASFNVYTDHVTVGSSSYNVKVGNAQHRWRLLGSGSNRSFDVWMDDQKVGSNVYISSNPVPRFDIDVISNNGVTATVVDVASVYIDSGLYPGGTGSGSPTTTTAGSLLVTCTNNGAVVQGAVVNMQNSSAWYETNTTTADGTALISNLSPGTYTVSATKTGMQSPTSQSVTIAASSTPTTVTFAFVATSTTGTVTATCVKDGNPLSGVSVSTVGKSNISDSSGTAELDSINPGAYTVHAGTLFKENVQVVAGQTTSLTFDFTSNTTTVNPPSPTPSNSTIPVINFNIDWSQIGKNLEAIVDANRRPMLLVGGLISLFSFIGFMLPPKRLPISF